jgi:Cu(I)-responsive transcriptional regulator
VNIGETSRQSGVSERMIRHYEKIGLIPAPARRGAGYRDGERDLHRLRFIANARDLGFPIEEIRTLLSLWANTGRASAEVKRLALARADEFQRKAEALTALRDTLIDLAERCQGDERPDCPIIAELARPDPHSIRHARPRIFRVPVFGRSCRSTAKAIRNRSGRLCALSFIRLARCSSTVRDVTPSSSAIRLFG